MFPRLNTALSTYLKNSRYRTGTSVALTAAVAAGVGAASTAAGTQPWIASLNGMAQAGHASATGSTEEMAGKNVFSSVVGTGSHTAATHAAAGARPGQAATRPTVQAHVADDHQQQSAPGRPSGIQALRPLPRHGAPLVPAGRSAAQGKALAARPAAPDHAAAAPAASKPVTPGPYPIYDSVSPGQIPSKQEQVAVYGNGSYQASWSAVHGRHRVLWIDTNGSNPGCDVLDVEPGDATPSGAAQWVKARLHQQPNSIAIVYTMMSEWPAVKSAIGSLSGEQQSHIRYWIADPTGVRHMVPGSSATQWYWGHDYDITYAQPNFTS